MEPEDLTVCGYTAPMAVRNRLLSVLMGTGLLYPASIFSRTQFIHFVPLVKEKSAHALLLTVRKLLLTRPL